MAYNELFHFNVLSHVKRFQNSFNICWEMLDVTEYWQEVVQIAQILAILCQRFEKYLFVTLWEED